MIRISTQRITWLSLLLISIIVFASTAMADKGQQTWFDSSRGDRERLSPWEYSQSDIHANRRDNAIKLADKGGESGGNYSNSNRHKRYEELTPEQREKLQKRREHFKSLPPEERERIQKARDKFHSMPAEERQKLKDKWRLMTPEERKRAKKYKKNKDHKD